MCGRGHSRTTWFYSLILCLRRHKPPTQVTLGPNSPVICSAVPLSVSPPLQPGHQGSTGRGILATPNTRGQPAPATPKKRNSCSSCFQPLHPDPEKAGGLLTLLGHPLQQVEDPIPDSYLCSLWSGPTSGPLWAHGLRHYTHPMLILMPFPHIYLVYGRGAHMPWSSVKAAPKHSSDLSLPSC